MTTGQCGQRRGRRRPRSRPVITHTHSLIHAHCQHKLTFLGSWKKVCKVFPLKGEPFLPVFSNTRTFQFEYLAIFYYKCYFNSAHILMPNTLRKSDTFTVNSTLSEASHFPQLIINQLISVRHTAWRSHV